MVTISMRDTGRYGVDISDSHRILPSQDLAIHTLYDLGGRGGQEHLHILGDKVPLGFICQLFLPCVKVHQLTISLW